MSNLRAKVAILGDKTTGKTSICKKYLDPSQFPKQYFMTNGCEFHRKQELVKGTQKEEQQYLDGGLSAEGEELKQLKEKPRMDLGENKGTFVELFLYDTSGHSICEDMIPALIEQFDFYIIVFDLTNSDSFTSIPKWTRFVSVAQESMGYKKPPQGILIGNKADLSSLQAISEEEAQKFAEKHGFLKYFHISCANDDVDAPFQFAAKKIHDLFLESLEEIKFISENVNQKE